MTWQTIDTAPNDGTPIIGLLDDGQSFIMRWWTKEELADLEDSRAELYIDCWCEWFDYTSVWEPSHWQPVDTLPKDHPVISRLKT